MPLPIPKHKRELGPPPVGAWRGDVTPLREDIDILRYRHIPGRYSQVVSRPLCCAPGSATVVSHGEAEALAVRHQALVYAAVPEGGEGC